MANVTIYTTSSCPYCIQAKLLLTNKGVAYREIDVTGDPAVRERMVAESGGRRTVPQIFLNGQPIGGFDDLKALDGSGKLDQLLTVGA